MGNQQTKWCCPLPSRTGAEYRSLALTITEIMWIRSLLSELRVPTSTSSLIYCDNLSAANLTANPILHTKTNHFALDLHFVRERVADKQVTVVHIPTPSQIADIFTKPVSSTLFHCYKTKLRVLEKPSPEFAGGVL